MSFTHADISPGDIAQHLADNNIFVWNGHNYAVEIVKALGIYETGGAVRIGPVHYNSVGEIDETLAVLHTFLSS